VRKINNKNSKRCKNSGKLVSEVDVLDKKQGD